MSIQYLAAKLRLETDRMNRNAAYCEAAVSSREASRFARRANHFERKVEALREQIIEAVMAGAM